MQNIVQVLQEKNLISQSKISDGGNINRILFELEQANFIMYLPSLFSASNESKYIVVDPFTLFALNWIEPYKKKTSNASIEGGGWTQLQTKQSFNIWSGYSFEVICFLHVYQIKKALGIESIHTLAGSWRSGKSNLGLKEMKSEAQIDLILDRDDGVINLCEIKYRTSPLEITKELIADLENKEKIFCRTSKTKKNIFLTLITSESIKASAEAKRKLQSSVLLDESI